MPWKRKKKLTEKEKRNRRETSPEFRSLIYISFFVLVSKYPILSNPTYNKGLQIGFGFLAGFSLFAWLVRHRI